MNSTSPTSARTGFQFNSSGVDRPGLDVVGVYVVSLVAVDSQGSRSTNDARVTLSAMPGEAIHVQLTWDHATADLDLHLLRSGTGFDSNDCYFANCDDAGGLNLVLVPVQYNTDGSGLNGSTANIDGPYTLI